MLPVTTNTGELPRYTVADLRRMPPQERDAALAAAAASAEADYLHDPELTAFEVFGEEDPHGDGSDSQPR